MIESGNERENGMEWTELLLYWLLATNGVAFVLCGADKFFARRGWRRIRERTLLGVAALGGSVGMLAGMNLFRHKTLKPAFRFGVPVILGAQLAAALLLLWKFG